MSSRRNKPRRVARQPAPTPASVGIESNRNSGAYATSEGVVPPPKPDANLKPGTHDSEQKNGGKQQKNGVKRQMEHFSLLLPSDMLSKLRVLAEHEERPVSALVRLAIKDYLNSP